MRHQNAVFLEACNDAFQVFLLPASLDSLHKKMVGKQLTSNDCAKIIDDIVQGRYSKVQHEISQLDKFFSGQLEKPLGKLNGAFDKVRNTVFSIKNTLIFEASACDETTTTMLATAREEEKITASAIP